MPHHLYIKHSYSTYSWQLIVKYCPSLLLPVSESRDISRDETRQVFTMVVQSELWHVWDHCECLFRTRRRRRRLRLWRIIATHSSSSSTHFVMWPESYLRVFHLTHCLLATTNTCWWYQVRFVTASNKVTVVSFSQWKARYSVTVPDTRDVKEFEFEFDDIRIYVFTRFEIWWMF